MVHFSTSPVMVVIGDFSKSGKDRLETNDMWEEDVWGFLNSIPFFHSILIAMVVTINIYCIKKILTKKFLDYAFMFKYEILQDVNFRRAFLFSLDQLP